MKFLFNASGAKIKITGFNVHPGSSKDTMINAAEVACEIQSLLPGKENPRYTEGYEGFYHLTGMKGDVACAEMEYIIRDHDEVPLPSYTAKSGTATTIVTDSAGLSTSLTSGYALLLSKGAGSANTDNAGTKRRISSCSVSGSTATITVAEGGTVSEGDVYLLIPDIGDEMYLDTSKTGAVFYNADSTVKLIAVCADSDRGTLGVKIKTHFLG